MTDLEIAGFPHYRVTSEGAIFNNKTGRVLSRRPNQQGILMSNMYDIDNRLRTVSVAFVVAVEFWGLHANPNFDTVMHKNGDRTDCRADNLVWRPRWFVIAFHKQFKKPPTPLTHKIVCLDTDEVFDTARDASVEYGLLEKDIISAAVNHTPVWPNHYEFRLYSE